MLPQINTTYYIKVLQSKHVTKLTCGKGMRWK